MERKTLREHIHVRNERMMYGGRTWFYCSCKKWLPDIIMGFSDEFVLKMRCREYLCPTCFEEAKNKNTQDKQLVRPMFTEKEYLNMIHGKVVGKQNT